jgi:hypothetical protein
MIPESALRTDGSEVCALLLLVASYRRDCVGCDDCFIFDLLAIVPVVVLELLVPVLEVLVGALHDVTLFTSTKAFLMRAFLTTLCM